MKITYDKLANAAYLELVPIKPGDVAKTYPCDPTEVGGMINLDFDKNGKLVGIEILDADKKLDESLLQKIN